MRDSGWSRMLCTALASSVKPGDIYIMKERHFWREFRNRVWNTFFCHLGRRIGWVFPSDTIFHDRKYQYKVGINEVTRGRFQNSNNVRRFDALVTISLTPLKQASDTWRSWAQSTSRMVFQLYKFVLLHGHDIHQNFFSQIVTAFPWNFLAWLYSLRL